MTWLRVPHVALLRGSSNISQVLSCQCHSGRALKETIGDSCSHSISPCLPVKQASKTSKDPFLKKTKVLLVLSRKHIRTLVARTLVARTLAAFMASRTRNVIC